MGHQQYRINVRRLSWMALLLAAALGALPCVMPGLLRVLAVGPSGNGDVNGDGSLDISDPVYLLSHLFLAGPAPVPISACPARSSTALVVRHAERFATGDDPCLTADGQGTAQRLKNALSRASLNAVLITDFCRTFETVNPTAQEHTLAVERFPGAPEIVAALRALPPGSTALVAGNSFNLPEMIKSLGIDTPVSVGNEYDNIWLINFSPGGETESKLTHLRY